MTDHLITISEPTLRRLPLYYQFLLRKKQNGDTSVSCPQIAQDLELTSIQVRKDLQSAGAVGRPRVGYVIDEVLVTLSELLGYSNTKDALLVGAGNLGIALLDYEGFEEHGLNIVAGFDVDEEKLGKVFQGKRIYDLSDFKRIASRLNIKIAIITTPASSAKEVCDIMIDSGIKAIWNFAPIHLSTPDDVIVENVNLTASLAVLSNRLERSID